MTRALIMAMGIAVLTSGCATHKQGLTHEELLSLQKQCHELKEDISNARGKPLIRTELRRRYDMECTFDEFL